MAGLLVLLPRTGHTQVPLQVIEGPEPSRGAPYRVDTLWMVGGGDDRGGLALGVAMGLAIDRRGRVFVSDSRLQVVHVIDTAGRNLGTLGRGGSGPGEFRLPSRVAIAPDGHIAVLDIYWGRVVEFDADLNFVRTVQLQPRVSVRAMVLTSEHIVVSGVEQSPRGGTSVLHIFSRTTGERLVAAGTWVQTRDPVVSRMVGAGPLIRDRTGLWWHAAPGPYQVQVYAAGGELLGRIERPNRFLPPAEDGFTVSAADGRMNYQYRQQAVTSGITETRRGTFLHQVYVNPTTVVTDEYAVDRSGPTPKLALLHSWIQSGMPVLGPEIGPNRFLILTADADGADGVALVRLTPVASPR